MEIKVRSLQLDLENPRFEPVASQRDAVNALLGEEPHKLVALATDIVDRGGLSPAEPLFVSNLGNGLVVLEGNRRVCSLKLLADPSLADDPSVRAQFSELSKRRSYPDTVDCTEFPDRESARHWIDLRHTGNNGGVGVEPWTAVQKARFRGGKQSQATRGLQFIDAIILDFEDDSEILQLADAAKKKITNVGRLVSDPDVRRAIGLSIQDNVVWWNYSVEATRKSLARVLSDLGEKSVSTFMTKDDRRDYVREIATATPSKSDLLDEPVPAGGLKAASNGNVAKSASKTRPGSRDERRVFERVKLRHVNPRTKRTLRQTHLLTFDQAPHVTAVMLRVVLELVLTEVGVGAGWFPESEKLHKKVVTAVRKLDPNHQDASKADPKLRPAYTIANVGGGGTAVLDLNSYVHHYEQDATAAEVRAYSGKFGPLVQALDDYVGTSKN